MMGISTLLAAAVVVEGVISWISTLVVDKKFQPQVLIALAIGLLVAFDFNLNIFATAGIEEAYPLLGVIFTGIVISRGSNYVYDLHERLTNVGNEIA